MFCEVALSADRSEVKALATKLAVDEDHVDEVDMVMNMSAFKSGNYDGVVEDIVAVVEAAKPYAVKVIIETCLLTDEEKVKACELVAKGGAAFVKTSTGFSKGGATLHDVEICGLDVMHGKPDPEPYLKAWERSGLEKEQCVVIENAPLGIRSGKAAGLTVYAVNTGILTREDLAEADEVFDSMAELLAYLQGK